MADDQELKNNWALQGFTLEQVCKRVPCGLTSLYQDARAGKVKIRKRGRTSIILAPDLADYLENLPVLRLGEVPAAIKPALAARAAKRSAAVARRQVVAKRAAAKTRPARSTSSNQSEDSSGPEAA